jgi:catechol 2,3-dioxygenase-like lactoylglutathione lyase family enzyme
MLGERDATVTIPVKDIRKARDFYEGKLGLKPQEEMGEGVCYRSGASSVFVYESEYAGTNKATAATWTVDDVDAEVQALKAKGIAFEHYDLEGAVHEGDVHVFGKIRNAWFKDPDGNILSVVNA